MTTVDEILNDIIKTEGGFVNDPKDHGGPTNMGITQKTLSDYLGRPASIEEVRNLKVPQVKEIYERRYVSDPRFDKLPVAIQPVVIDAGVLHGTGRATKFLQQVLNQAGFGPVNEDGILGPTTRGLVEKAVAEMGPFFINAICDERQAYCDQIVANRPDQARFINGWTNRVNHFRVEVPDA
jgi:lysozyme family protein